MNKPASMVALALACALPMTSFAQTAPATNAKHDSNPQSVDTAKLRSANGNDQSPQFDREEPARGGGERAAEAGRAMTNPAPRQAANDAHAHQLHMASPHIILVQSKIDAAQADLHGIDRLASLERMPLSAEYREHANAFAQDLGGQISQAREHLQHLRGSVANLQSSTNVQSQIQQADRALLQASADLSRMNTIGAAVRPTNQQPVAQGVQARQFSNWSDFESALSGDLNSAKSAIDGIERSLR